MIFPSGTETIQVLLFPLTQRAFTCILQHMASLNLLNQMTTVKMTKRSVDPFSYHLKVITLDGQEVFRSFPRDKIMAVLGNIRTTILF